MFGLWPRFVFWFVFGCLLRCCRWRNASLAGGFAGRRFWCGCVSRLLFYRFAYSKDFFVLVQCFDCLLTCKDRAISATSAKLEEKKTLVATRRCRCLLRSARVNVMPERLLSVISGILAGGIPGFRIELCCFYHPLTWPLCVVLCFLCFASCSVAILIMTHKMSSCMLFPLLVAIPLLCVFVCFGLVVVVCFFCLLGFFCFWLWFFSCWDSSLKLRTGPLPVLLWLSTSRQPCMIITIHLFAAIERV